MKIISLILFSTVIALESASAAISSMVGEVTMRSARVWFADDSNAPITAVCSPSSAPDKKNTGIFLRIPSSQNGNTGEISFENLDAGTEYSYIISKNGTTEVVGGTFKTRPDFEDRTPPPDFSFAVFGANHINDAKYDPPFQTPGGEYEIFESARKSNPAFALWIGGANNLRKADAGARGATVLRARDLRNLPEAGKLLSAQANYGVAAAAAADGGAGYAASPTTDAANSFDLIWANPDCATPETKAYSFKYSDAEIFVLDDFFERKTLDYKSDKPRMLGDKQLKWLFEALSASKSKFKILVMNSPIANPVKSDANFTRAVEERKALFDFLSAKKITGLVIVAGNKPYGELTRMVRAGAYPVFEASPSPMTARPSAEAAEMNYFRVPSSTVGVRSFLQVKIDGTENARAVTFTYFDSKGKSLFSHTIKEEELRIFD